MSWCRRTSASRTLVRVASSGRRLRRALRPPAFQETDRRHHRARHPDRPALRRTAWSRSRNPTRVQLSSPRGIDRRPVTAGEYPFPRRGRCIHGRRVARTYAPVGTRLVWIWNFRNDFRLSALTLIGNHACRQWRGYIPCQTTAGQQMRRRDQGLQPSETGFFASRITWWTSCKST